MATNKAVIPSLYLYTQDICNLKLVLDDNNETLITGKVLDPFNNPVANAGIEIIQVSTLDNSESTVGCIFSDLSGEYAFTLSIAPNYYYTFKLYSKL